MKVFLLFFLFGIRAYGQDDTTKVKYLKPLFDFNKLNSLFIFEGEQKYNQNKFLRYYALTGYREGVDPTYGEYGFTFDAYTDTLLNTRRLFMYNLSLVEMFTHGLINDDRVILEVKDPSKYRFISQYGDKEEWIRKNTYCFEYMLPNGIINIRKLDEALQYIFNVKFRKELRSVMALVLVKTSELEKFKSLNVGKPSYDGKGLFNNTSFDALRVAIGYTGMPFIDETGYKGRVDLKLNIATFKDIESLQYELKRYDLNLKKEIRKVNVFVISETN